MVPGAGVEPAHPYEREILRMYAPLQANSSNVKNT